MLVDAWAAYFAQQKREGKGDLIEDESFDLDSILEDLDRKAAERDLEPAETWTPES